MYTPPMTQVQISVLGPLNRPSLFDVRLGDPVGSLFGPSGSVFDGWCLAMNVYLDPATASKGTFYSPYEMGTLSLAGLPIGSGPSALNNLDSINWLINEYDGSNYTWGEVQAAIWVLLGDDWNLFASALGNPDASKVNALAGQALANDGFVPDAGQFLGLVMDVRDANGTVMQPVLIETRAAKLGDRVFEDKNANGVQDSGEPGIPGAIVHLVRDLNGDGDFDDDNELLATTTTDGNGNYSFKGLMPGVDYQVVFKTPNGYDGVSPRQAGGTDLTDSDGLVSDVITLEPGEYNASIDSGFYKYASLGDRVWLDANGNGQQDSGEVGQSGVTVNLLNSAGNIIATQITGDGGLYLFSSLIPGVYAVEFVKPAGFDFTGKDVGNDASDSDADPISGKTGNYTLSSGEANRTVDAGLVVTAPQVGMISGTVREDLDNDDTGDVPIAGVSIVLKNAAGNIIASTTTAPDGSYKFTNLPAGTYTVHETNKAGYNDVNDVDGGDPNLITVNLPAGGNSPGNDFVDDRPVSIGDRVWLDANGNGQQDFGEAGVPGVTVNLKDAGGNVISSQVTGTGGVYLFTNLDAGTYSVQFVKPTGFDFTSKDVGGDVSDSDADPTTGMTGNYTLQSGDENRTVDAGLVRQVPQVGMISGTVREDLDNDDTGDVPIAGVSIVLKNAAGNIIASTTTAPDGSYKFTNVPAGTYTVHETNKAGYNDVNDVDGGDPNVITVNLPAGGNSPGNDFVDDRSVSIGDRVWLDANGNGLQDGGEAGVSGVTVNLLNQAGGVVGTQQTNTSGNYLFTNLDAGTYRVQFVKPAGFDFTSKDAGNDNSDSDADPTTGITGNYTLQSGDDNRTVDAGLVRPAPQLATIGDLVFEDRNANGIQDAGEAGIAGVTVQLKDAGGNVVQTTTTSATGVYSFQTAPGTYSVQVTAPNGYMISPKDQGGDDAKDSDIGTNGMTGSYTLTAGQVNNTVDAGLFRKAAVGDKVFFDKNGNGLQDAGEAGVANLAVKLLNAAGAVVATQNTNANGEYLFSDLTPGTYSVLFSKPSGYDFTTRDVGSNDAIDSDADANGRTASFTLVSGETNRTVDAGIAPICRPVTFDFSGNSYLSGAYGNVRTWTDAATGVTVTARAFSQDKGTNNFDTAYVGAYGGGLGVTDRAEGNGSGNSHTLDNVGKNNYIVLQFSQAVEVDRAYLGYVSGDSDAQIWIANSSTTVTSLSSSILSSALFTEINSTTSSNARWMDLNAPGTKGNIFVIAADTTDKTPDDSFKFEKLTACVTDPTVPTGNAGKATIGDRVWVDWNHDGKQLSATGGEGAAINVKVLLQNASGKTVATTTTDQNGFYRFENLDPGTYRVGFDKSSGRDAAGNSIKTWAWAEKNVGGNGQLDSDVTGNAKDTVYTAYTTLAAGQIDLSWDAGVTPIVIDLSGNGIHTISRSMAGGSFDLLGNGQAIKSGWISSGNGFLAIDVNGNGRIDSINELFGGLKKGDGFAKLASFDSNGDGVVDALDDRFAELRIWQDLNGNHETDDGELMTLAQAGITSLNVGFTELAELDAQGNLLLERSVATRTDGSQAAMVDVYFNVSGADAAKAGVTLPSLQDLLHSDGVDGLLGAGGETFSSAAFDSAGAEAAEMLRQLAAMSRADLEQHACMAA